MTEIQTALSRLAGQDQFLDVIDRDEATARFHAHLRLRPLGTEYVPLHRALHRVLASRVVSDVDVPGFDRSNVDGFAVRADDTSGAGEQSPRVLRLNEEILTPGVVPEIEVKPGTATLIATGGMIPRGADAVVLVEQTQSREEDGATSVEIRRPAGGGQFIAFAGGDIARGETVLRAGRQFSSREIGMLAAIGHAEVEVYVRPRVAIISTGDEIIAPGAPMRPGAVYDSNAAIIAASVEEAGGEPVPLGIGADDEPTLRRLVAEGLGSCDLIVMSGGTSKGAGDLCYRTVADFSDPGIVVHGVALKPGKPLCLAVTGGKPVVVLPGFPTSAIFTFHSFVAPVIRAYAGRADERGPEVEAVLPMRISSERGRTEFMMVSLVPGKDGEGLAAYPLQKGSGAVTTFAQADGFIAIERQSPGLAAGTTIRAELIGNDLELADLVTIGSHCVGLDMLIDRLAAEGIRVKALNVGSMGGLAAAKRGECDIAGMHLMDEATGTYNVPFLTEDLAILPGYRRLQGIVPRRGDPRFEGRTTEEAIAAAQADPACLMVGRNAGSGTRILIDRLLNGARPAGYWSQPKSHGAVAVAVAQERADWGLAIESVARDYNLGFIPVQDEFYDFVIPRARLEREPVKLFRKLLQQAEVKDALQGLGFAPHE